MMDTFKLIWSLLSLLLVYSVVALITLALSFVAAFFFVNEVIIPVGMKIDRSIHPSLTPSFEPVSQSYYCDMMQTSEGFKRCMEENK